ncbi:MAG: S-layer family protein, partial [Waterburya sp.]
DSLSLDNNSLISTSVLDSTGGGGNIVIDNSGFIIGKNNSNIKANAVFGQGGNIQIKTQGLFFDASSKITASSEFGVDGIVEINGLELNKRLNNVQFPQRISTPEAVIISSCPVPEQNTFAVTGSGGIPENPSSYLKGRTLWQDARRLINSSSDSNQVPTNNSSNSTKKVTSNNDIIESQRWIINQRGKVELVAATVPKIGQQGIKCGDL